MVEYEWNKVFRLVMKIKREYIDKFDTIAYEKYGDKSCLEYWTEHLGAGKYKDIFKYLNVDQYENMVLIRYGNYSDVLGGEENITSDMFWDMHNGLYRECRSVVIDLKLEIIVLSPFEKFKNLNEGEENQLDLVLKEISNAKSIEITNKLDGSMQSARWVPEYCKIIMSGSQAINMDKSWRLRDGYNCLMGQRNYVSMITENPRLTFIFEYIGMNDAHVVNYTKEQEGLYLVGARNVYSGEQLSYQEVKVYSDQYGVWMTEIFDKSFDDVLKDIKTIKANEMEGFVINIDGRLIKVKADDYVDIHRILSNISSINLIIKNIVLDTYDDLVSKVPLAYKWRVVKVANIVFDYIKNTDAEVRRYFEEAPKQDRKTFMVWVNNNVEKKYISYVRNLYLGRDNNYIMGGNEKSPSFKTLKEMGVDDYMGVFEIEK